MKAGVVYGPMDIKVEEVDVPTPGRGEVLLKVKAAGICGSDLHYHRSAASKERVRRLMGGHELSGYITEVGEGVTSRLVGERVGVEPLLGCGNCNYCQTGRYHLCKGLKHPGGGFQEYTVLSQDKVFPIPDQVTYEEAATLDCFAVAVHAVHRSALSIADSVAVIGDGAIGLSTLQIAKVSGAKNLALIGHHDKNLEIGKKVGADLTINSKKDDVLPAILEFTNGDGCDIVFETVGGRSDTINRAIEMTRPGGRVVVIGIFTVGCEIPLWKALRYEIDVIFSYSYSTWNGQSEFQIALDLLSKGRIDARSLITHKFTIDKLKDAFACALNKDESSALKVMITYP